MISINNFNFHNMQREIIYTLIIIIVLTGIKWSLNKIINRRLKDVKTAYQWRKIITYLSFFFALILILPMWIRGFGTFVTYLGLSTAGLAIALKDLLSSMVAWIFILWKRPFSIGDRIEIDGKAGDVIDIRLFQFSINEIGRSYAEQSTGCVVHIPNYKILTESIRNYTSGFSFIWDEITILITFESDWQKAKRILLEIVEEETGHFKDSAEYKVKEAAKKYLVFYKNLSPIVYTKVKDSGVLLTMRFICEPRQKRVIESKVWERVLFAFNKEKTIDFAYPTTRLYGMALEENHYSKKISKLESEGFSDDKI
ncbi:mechanosensitive ion channel family protein [Natronospora cellulosivora (SeqCode)]